MARQLPSVFYFDSPLRLVPAPDSDELQTTAEGGGEEAKLRVRHVLEAIHAGSTVDYRYIDPAELEPFAATFLDPYPRPVQIDHSRSVLHTVGRVKASRVIDSQMKPGYKAVELEVDVVDPEAERRIQDGRYLTVSLGFGVKEVRCSICDVNWREQDCEHWPGRTYDGKLCEMRLKGLTAHEVSFVAVPADAYAGIKATAQEVGKEVTGMEKLEEIDVDVQEVIAAVTPQETQTEEVASTPTEAGAAPTEEAVEPETETDAEELDSLAMLTADVQVLSESLEELKSQIAQLSERLGQVEGKLAKAEEETASVFAANVTLAREVRKGLIERIIDLELVSGKLTASAEAPRSEELATKRTSELAALVQDLHKQATQRQIATIETPIKQDTRFDSASGKKTTFTLDEYEEALSKLVRPVFNDSL